MIYSTNKPNGFKEGLEVVACFIEDNNGFVLFLLRAENKEVSPLKWASPAGGINPDELREDAIVREVKEGTGLKLPKERIEYIRPIYVIFESGANFVFHMFRFQYACRPNVILNDESSAYVWIRPEHALASLNLMEDVADCIRLVFGHKHWKAR